jgi:large subunit ribosomal protein L23
MNHKFSTNHDIILQPLLSEKSVGGKANNKYCFVVARGANKVQIRKAIEELFKVKVEKVNTMNYEGKERRVGQFQGHTSRWKKAVVTLKDGEEIKSFFEGI